MSAAGEGEGTLSVVDATTAHVAADHAGGSTGTSSALSSSPTEGATVRGPRTLEGKQTSLEHWLL